MKVHIYVHTLLYYNNCAWTCYWWVRNWTNHQRGKKNKILLRQFFTKLDYEMHPEEIKQNNLSNTGGISCFYFVFMWGAGIKPYSGKHRSECDKWGKILGGAPAAGERHLYASVALKWDRLQHVLQRLRGERGGFSRRVKDCDATQCKSWSGSDCSEYTFWKIFPLWKAKRSSVPPAVFY